eukprot:373180_1
MKGLFGKGKKGEKDEAMAAGAATSDVVVVPKGHRERRRNNSGGKEMVLQELPTLRDTPATKREELFKKKLELCSICFDFEDPNADKRGKEMKRSTLLELVDYVNAQS